MIGRAFWCLAVMGVAATLNLSCSDRDERGTEASNGAAGSTSDEPWKSEPLGACNAVEQHFTQPTATHVPPCSDIEYPMSPPVYGDHYPSWPAYRAYEYPVPLGYLVHGLEHGAVIVLYDCPEGCDDEVADARAFIDALPPDPRCSEVAHQVIIAPQPGLGARWAAAAWGYSLVAECFDASIFGQFYEDHIGRGPEDLCNQGQLIAEGACSD